MKIVFSLDDVINMDLLYTKSHSSDGKGYEIEIEHYHGEEYCKSIIISLQGWSNKEYIGSRGRVANESFILTASDGLEYVVSFAINTYAGKTAHMEVIITAPVRPTYDQQLESLKISIKDLLLQNWQICTWMIDEQTAALCKDAYERVFIIENKLRAFACKVLTHFLGVNWLQRAGLEKEAESVASLKDRFVQRVPEFSNINVDYFSMTLETLAGIILNGIVYNETIELDRQNYIQLMRLRDKHASAENITDFVNKRRVVDKNIWKDLFLPYIDEPDQFKSALANFINDRNHIAHSKILSHSAYQRVLENFDKMESLIQQADFKFDQIEASSEMMETWEIQQDMQDPDEDSVYYRDLIVNETDLLVLGYDDILDFFEMVLYELHTDVYKRYHLDVDFVLTDYSPLSESEIGFTIACSVDQSHIVQVRTEHCIDDTPGSNSSCRIIASNLSDNVNISTVILFHNGNGILSDDGFYTATDSAEYDDSDYEDFKEALFDMIDHLNPYPDLAAAIALREKGAIPVLADFSCEQCGKLGVSLTEELLPLGKCCYCGWMNKLARCMRCDELYNGDDIKEGLCPSCAMSLDDE